MNYALCFGINNYVGTGNDLNGCINDAEDLNHAILSSNNNFTTVLSLDSTVTISYVLYEIDILAAKAVGGDNVFISYSGHGTQLRNSLEADGYDEALYLYDGSLRDDVLREHLDKFADGVNVVLFLDSCFSGGMLKKINPKIYKRPRFVVTDEIPEGAHRVKAFMADTARHLIMSGCSEDEYSYDAYFDGRYNGAFTYWAVKLFVHGMTYQDWFDAIRTELPSNIYPQTPLLLGSEALRTKKALGLDGNQVEPNPEPTPEPDPEPDEPTDPVEPEPNKDLWYYILLIWNWIKKLFK